MAKSSLPHLGDYEHSALRHLWLMQERYKKEHPEAATPAWTDREKAKANRQRIENIRRGEELHQPSDHDDLLALHFVDLRKRKEAESTRRGKCPRCGGRILDGSCINCGYV
jgi:hypothetical protein